MESRENHGREDDGKSSSNHEKMLEEDIPEHNYFAVNYFKQIKTRYDEAKKYLTSLRAKKIPKLADEQTMRLNQRNVMLQD